jgi:1,4-alpha-glucan branching enzyme
LIDFEPAYGTGTLRKERSMKTATHTRKTRERRSPIRKQSSAAFKAASANKDTPLVRATNGSRHSQAAEPARKVSLLPEYLPSRISLWLYQPNAKEVRLAGSFNNWDPRANPLQHDGEGCWRVELILARGRYEYRFVVDGNWIDDPLAAAYVANPFGTLNCLLLVG